MNTKLYTLLLAGSLAAGFAFADEPEQPSAETLNRQLNDLQANGVTLTQALAQAISSNASAASYYFQVALVQADLESQPATATELWAAALAATLAYGSDADLALLVEQNMASLLARGDLAAALAQSEVAAKMAAQTGNQAKVAVVTSATLTAAQRQNASAEQQSQLVTAMLNGAASNNNTAAEITIMQVAAQFMPEPQVLAAAMASNASDFALDTAFAPAPAPETELVETPAPEQAEPSEPVLAAVQIGTPPTRPATSAPVPGGQIAQPGSGGIGGGGTGDGEQSISPN